MRLEEPFLVTGAGGFIGGWLVETLYLSGSTSVRAGIHSWSSAARLARFPIEIVPCDVMNTEQIARAISGVTHVIHCAKASREVTVQGTRNMLEAALEAGVRRFVYISTTEVYGSQTGNIDETCSCELTGHPYGDSKIEAERLCWEYYEKGLPVTLIRPPIVYGPFSKDWTVRLALSLQSGNWGIFKGYGQGSCNLIYIADLVSGILLAMKQESATGEAFNLVGPEVITWNEYFRRFDTALGLPELRVIDPSSARLRVGILEPTRSIAKFLLGHFGNPLKKISQGSRQAKGIMKAVEKTIKTSPRSEDLSLYNREVLYLTKKARDKLGFTPSFEVRRGLDMSCRWLRHAGLVG